ncbi:hypothetical protein AU509_02410 [Lonsdalea britannica]|nr:hypothetical protein AU509_02410 [Lonsdalea britannica]
MDKQNHEVVTGTNIPMLVETFMARDDDPRFADLVAIALEAGRAGVKALKTADAAPAKPAAKPPPPPWPPLAPAAT